MKKRTIFKFNIKKIATPPGSLISGGEEKTEKINISSINYDETQFQEKVTKNIEELLPLKDDKTITWINIDGIHDPKIIEKIGAQFNLHPLLLEDIMNTGHRPKMEDYEKYLFVVLKMIQYNENDNQLMIEQVSLLIGPNYVISFQEKKGDIFDPIRERIRNKKGRISKMGADYLAYSLIDTIIDNYFLVLEALGEKIEDLEEELVTNPIPETLRIIHILKRELIILRKSVWPLRELISGLERIESTLFKESIGIYLRDLYDHTIQIIDTVESFRDMVSGMLDIYLSSISNRMNEIMKVLTIIATIFIPLTFIAGLYGMNFHFMPELAWTWGYPIVLLGMLAIGIVMLIYFRRKKWL